MAEPYRWGDATPAQAVRIRQRREHRASSLYALIKKARGRAFDEACAASMSALLPSSLTGKTSQTEGAAMTEMHKCAHCGGPLVSLLSRDDGADGFCPACTNKARRRAMLSDLFPGATNPNETIEEAIDRVLPKTTNPTSSAAKIAPPAPLPCTPLLKFSADEQGKLDEISAVMANASDATRSSFFDFLSKRVHVSTRLRFEQTGQTAEGQPVGKIWVDLYLEGLDYALQQAKELLHGRPDLFAAPGG